jgi:DNA segregation ATPase FtsK/SpoIIIE, S-DNA-T family
MARRKTLIRIPFLKTKINSKTVFNIFGFLIVGFSFILLISFIHLFSPSDGGVLLKRINDALMMRFGILSLFVPFM